MHKIKFQLGDWSGDGHSQHEDFILESSVPVEELREMYFATKKKTKISPEHVCKDYGDWEITPEHIKGLGLRGKTPISEPEGFINMFIDYMTTHNPELTLTLVENNIPAFHFYGVDKKGRHIGSMGYGMFSE